MKDGLIYIAKLFNRMANVCKSFSEQPLIPNNINLSTSDNKKYIESDSNILYTYNKKNKNNSEFYKTFSLNKNFDNTHLYESNDNISLFKSDNLFDNINNKLNSETLLKNKRKRDDESEITNEIYSKKGSQCSNNIHISTNISERVEDEYLQSFIRQSKDGWYFSICICNLIVKMGPFSNLLKTKYTLNFIINNQNILTLMEKDERKKWISDFSELITNLV